MRQYPLNSSPSTSTPSKRSLFKYSLLVAWLGFTVALVIWWFLFGLAQLTRLRELDVENAAELARQHSMLLWEGGTLVVSVLAGGLALGWYVVREVRQAKRLRLFFLTLTHDLKTPLARLRLELEKISDAGEATPEDLDRLQNEATRLNLLIENSLLLAQVTEESLTIRDVQLSDCVRRIQDEWPGVAVYLKGNPVIQADQRAFESVLRNLVSNSVTHGGATRVDIACAATEDAKLHIRVSDNGQGKSDLASDLGYEPCASKSGSGIGLYLSRLLLERMNGMIRIDSTVRSGFAVDLLIPGKLQ